MKTNKLKEGYFMKARYFAFGVALALVAGCEDKSAPGRTTLPSSSPSEIPVNGNDKKVDVKVRAPGVNVDVEGKGNGGGVNVEVDVKKKNP